MLASFRKASQGGIVKIFLVLLIASFAMWGIGDIFRGSAGSTVAEVGDQSIDAASFSGALNQDMQQLYGIFGTEVPPQMQELVYHNVLGTMVRRALFIEEMNALDIRVAEQTMLDKIQLDSRYETEGKFDKAKLLAALRQMNMSEKQFFTLFRQDLGIELLINGITGHGVQANALAELSHGYGAEQRKIRLYQLPANAITAPAAPTEAQLQHYFNQHEDNYVTSEYRSFDYLAISKHDADGDEDAFYALLNQAEDLLAAGSTLSEVAKELSLPLQNVPAVDKNAYSPSGTAVDNADAIRNMLPRVMAMEEGEEPSLLEQPDNSYLAVTLAEITLPRQQALDEVRGTVAEAWKHEQQNENLLRAGEDIIEQIQSGQTATTIANAYQLKPVKTITLSRSEPADGLPAGLLDEVFILQEGSPTSQYQDSNGDVVIAQYVEKISAKTPTEAVLEQQLAQIQNAWSNDLLESYQLYLEQKHGVQIHMGPDAFTMQP